MIIISDYGPSTALFIGVVTLAIYFFLLRPTPQPQQTQPGPSRSRQAKDIVDAKSSSNVPPHLSPKSKPNAHGSNVLVDGLITFRHTLAAVLHVSDTDAALNRKDRAKILNRLLEATGKTALPPKGSTMVVAVPENEVGCSKLQRVLYILGCHYNLLVILVGSGTFDYDGRLAQLRRGGGDVSEKVIPDHRIVAATTVSGRVAFVRQIQRVELVLDFDPQVEENLTRFGHAVFTYGRSSSWGGGSKLGNSLLP